MYEIVYNKKFKSAYKKIIRSGRFDIERFQKIVAFFVEGIDLPVQYRDHALTGNLSGRRECHISGDTLLIYEVYVEKKIVVFDNIGNHAQLFK
ncbi:MAG: type II toxin-antitoxin system YafQ family toxin [bacterium]|nr:type II toxin-antitoxin system YafQ family toxin [bacterium]